MDRNSTPQARSPQPSPPPRLWRHPCKTGPPRPRRTCSPPSTWDPELPNRIVMAPLTRSRAGAGNVPHELNALYYAQRASAGLIISEATQIAPEGQGYISTPGIHSAEQIEGWKCVTKAVHIAGGPIVLQLWHVGRISHQSFQPAAHCRWRPRPSGRMAGLHGERLRADPDAARARTTRSPGSSRNMRKARATRSPPGSTASRCTAPTAI